MKAKLFLRSFILLFAGILGGAAAATAIIHSRPESAEFLTWTLPRLLWLLPVSVCVAAPASWLLTCGITNPIGSIDPENPGTEAPYEELVPMLARIRQQERVIRRQEELLGQTRRDFAAITENMGEGFLLLDKRLNVLSRNAAASRILPPPPEKEADNLNRSGCPEEVLRAAERALAGRRTELTLQVQEQYYYVIATPVSSENQITGAVVIALDTTERERREALRREFSANVSHELKTPLTSISGFAELLKNGMVPQERVAEFSSDIYDEARRLMALVDDIIQLSRLEDDTNPPEKVPVDIYVLAENAFDTLRTAAEKNNVTMRLCGESTIIPGVRAALQEMVFNLCDNAVKYNRPGGTVTVTVKKTEHEAVLSVEDTGIGIPYEHQSRVFERFYRVDKSHSRRLGGTGLGLSIVKHAAAMHKARLELQSEPDVGTRVSVYFDMP